jgi:hypothetical protein
MAYDGGDCGVLLDGSAWCQSYYIGASYPAEFPAGSWTKISGQYTYPTGLQASGALSWLAATPPTPTVPLPLGTFIDFETTNYGTRGCALRTSGAIACWGEATNPTSLSYPTTGIPAGSFAQIAVGGQSACALNAAGAATCWPSDASTTGLSGTYVAIDTFSYQMYSGGPTYDNCMYARTCMVDSNGSPVCAVAAGTGPCSALLPNPLLSPPGFPYLDVVVLGSSNVCFRRSDAIDCVQFQYTSPQQTWVTLPGTFASMAQADNAATLATLAVDGELRMWSVGLGTLAHADTALTGY